MQTDTTAPRPDSLEKQVVRNAIRRQQEQVKISPETFGGFLNGVQEKVGKDVTTLKGLLGRGWEMARGIWTEFKSYKDSKQKFLSPKFKIAHLAPQGLAGKNEKQEGNLVTLDQELTNDNRHDPKKEHYCTCVAKHELVHANEQAGEFNADRVRYVRAGAAEPAELTIKQLLEGHASASQPEEHLTAEYRDYKATYLALVAHLGSDKAVKEALKTGDIIALQDVIDAKRMGEPPRRNRKQDRPSRPVRVV